MGKRTTFYFPTKAATQLSSIMRRSRLENGADVVRAALSAYDELLEVTEAGRSIVVRDKAGQEWPYSPHFPCNYPGLALGELDTNVAAADEVKTPKNFVFSEEAAAKLDFIKSRSRFRSNADVIRAALGAYDELVRVIMAGDRIIIRDEIGNEQSYSPYAPLMRIGMSAGVKRSEPKSLVLAPLREVDEQRTSRLEVETTDSEVG